MSQQLRDTYSYRADLADLAPDVDAVLAEVADIAARRAQRRRNLRAAGGGVIAVGAVAGILVGTGAIGDGSDPTPVPPGHPSISQTVAAPTLVTIDPAPASAATSITLVPQGFEYLGVDASASVWGEPGTLDQGTWLTKLTVSVDNPPLEQKYPLTIDGRPAAYSDGVIDIQYNAQADITIQAPVHLGVTEDQLIQIAQTLDVRNTDTRASG